MEEDLILLGLKIKRDPTTYRDEYSAQLKTLDSLIRLPNPPARQIKPMIFFLVRYCSVDPCRSVRLLVDALDAVKDYKTKKVILSGLVIVRQKRYIESKELLRLVITHGNDLRYFLKNVQEFLDTGCYSVLVEWFRKGTERQKCFCYFLLLVLFSKIHDVSDRKKMERDMVEAPEHPDMGLFGHADSIDTDDILNTHDSDSNGSDGMLTGKDVIAESGENSLEGSEENEKESPYNLIKDEVKFDNSSNIVDLDELESIISGAFCGSSRISKICCLYFLNRTEVKFDISKLRRGQEYSKGIHKELAEDVIDRDMKLMKLKIFVLFKGYFKVKKSVIKVILKMIDLEKEDLKDLLDCLVGSVDKSEAKDVLKVISDEFAREGQQDDVVVYGMNVMREIYSRFAGYDEDDAFLEEIKELILQYIECFKGNRTKSIFFAYRMVLKVLVKNEAVERSIDHVKKTATREEKTAMRKRGKEDVRRLREEAKREEKQEKYRKKTKGRKRSAMLKYMLKPNSKKTGKGKRGSKPRSK